jgi:hypothetical protein
MHEYLSDEAVLVWVYFLECFGVILGTVCSNRENDCDNGEANQPKEEGSRQQRSCV